MVDAGPTPAPDGGAMVAITGGADGAVGQAPSLDAGLPRTAHEREEAAKDALARARRLIRSGDMEQARAALEEARRYDPGNPDILALEVELR